jgi:CheY-like chemotaxis protein
LIVDDDPAAAKAIQRALRQAGFETRIAADGFAAGTLLESFEPSAVTLDLNMPGIGGLEVIRYIRRNPRFASVKVLVVSALDQAKLDEAVASGADDALAKPYKNQVLVDKVLAMVGATEGTT